MVAKVADFEASDLPERVKLALRFTEGWTLYNARTIDDELIAAMREHFTDAQLVELATIVGIYDSAHKFNVAFDIERDSNDLYDITASRVPRKFRAYVDELRAARGEQPAAQPASSGG